MVQDLTDVNISVMAVKNLLAPIILLLEVAEVIEVAVPNKLIEDDNINNYNSIN